MLHLKSFSIFGKILTVNLPLSESAHSRSHLCSKSDEVEQLYPGGGTYILPIANIFQLFYLYVTDIPGGATHQTAYRVERQLNDRVPAAETQRPAQLLPLCTHLPPSALRDGLRQSSY